LGMEKKKQSNWKCMKQNSSSYSQAIVQEDTYGFVKQQCVSRQAAVAVGSF